MSKNKPAQTHAITVRTHLFSSDVDDYEILVNAHNVYTPEDTADWYDVIEILPSTLYIAGDSHDDVALIKTTLMSNIIPICIAAEEPATGSPVTVTGWGDTTCK